MLLLALLSLPLHAKPIEKSKDWTLESELKYAADVDSRHVACIYEAVRDTKAAGKEMAAGDRMGGICTTVGEVAVEVAYEWTVHHGAGGELYWGKRVDNGQIDLIFRGGKGKKAFEVRSTAYDQAWSPLLSGTTDAERAALFVGRDQGDGTWLVDVLGPDGEFIGSLDGVVDVDDYGHAYLVQRSWSGQTVHQLLSGDGAVLTPMLPGLHRVGQHWVLDTDDDLVLPVLDDGHIGRAHPRVRGYAPLEGVFGVQAWKSVWELPDGSTAYGIAGHHFEDRSEGRFRSVEIHPIDDVGGVFVFAEDVDGWHTAWELHANYEPVVVGEGDSPEALVAQLRARSQARQDKVEAEAKAEEARRKQQTRQAMLARRAAARQAEAAQAELDGKLAEVNALLDAGDLGSALEAAYDAHRQTFCDLSLERLGELDVDQAHTAMIHCYYSLSYQDWLRVDAAYMRLSSPPPAPVSTAASYSSWGSSSGQGQQAPASLGPTIQQQQFDRAVDRFIEGSSSFDPYSKSWGY